MGAFLGGVGAPPQGTLRAFLEPYLNVWVVVLSPSPRQPSPVAAATGRRRLRPYVQERPEKPESFIVIDFLNVFWPRLFGFPTVQDGPRSPENRPKTAKETPRRAPRRPGGAPKRPTKRPRKPTRAPRRPQERPKRENTNRTIELSAPRCPREAPRGPQDSSRGPNRPDTAPRDPLEAPRGPLTAHTEAPRGVQTDMNRA